jgi:hypothetical protein
MRFESSSGRIDFGRGTLERCTSRDSFVASALGAGAQILVENDPHVTYGIRPEDGIAAAVYFEGAKLRSVSLQFQLPSGREAAWSVESERERKRMHDAWLQAEMGSPPYEFPWGRLESIYDSKGCSSSIIMSYAD